MMPGKIAFYVRTSAADQNPALQVEALSSSAWAKQGEVAWYKDVGSGKADDRPSWLRLQADIAAGEVGAVVVWKLDRLGRTVKELANFFSFIDQRGIKFISLTEVIDTSSITGRLMRDLLCAFASYETEVRRERQMAGMAEYLKKTDRNKGGRPRGSGKKLTPLVVRKIEDLRAKGLKTGAIARVLKISRESVRTALADSRPDGGRS